VVYVRIPNIIAPVFRQPPESLPFRAQLDHLRRKRDEGDLALGLTWPVDVSGDFRSSSPSVDRAQANSSRSTIFSSVVVWEMVGR